MPVFSLCKAFSFTQCTNTLPIQRNANRSENLRPWHFSIATIDYNSPQYLPISIIITENGSLHPSPYADSKVSLLPTIGAVKFLYSLFAYKKLTSAPKIPLSYLYIYYILTIVYYRITSKTYPNVRYDNMPKYTFFTAAVNFLYPPLLPLPFLSPTPPLFPPLPFPFNPILLPPYNPPFFTPFLPPSSLPYTH